MEMEVPYIVGGLIPNIFQQQIKRGLSMGQSKNKTNRRRFLGGAATGMGIAAVPGVSLSGEGFNNPFKKEFSGKTAFVTGGARGIGFACAESLAKRGANVVLFDIASQISGVPYPLASEEDLQNAQAQILSYGVGCLVVRGDVRDEQAQADAVNQAVSTFGSLDFVVANAGITQLGQIENFSEAELSLVIDINLKGVIKTIQAVTPILREQNSGRIVTMSSVTGRGGANGFPIYGATKWGVIGLTKTTAQALGPHNVTCNALCPTLVRTGLLENDYVMSAFNPGGEPMTWDQFTSTGPSAHLLPVRYFEPEVVGEAAAFLCSEGSAMISGDVFDIAGGANAGFPA